MRLFLGTKHSAESEFIFSLQAVLLKWLQPVPRQVQGEGHKHTHTHTQSCFTDFSGTLSQSFTNTKDLQEWPRSQEGARVGSSQGVHSFSETTSLCLLPTLSDTLSFKESPLAFRHWAACWPPHFIHKENYKHKARPQSVWAFSVLTGRPIRVTKKSSAIKETTEMCWRSWEGSIKHFIY